MVKNTHECQLGVIKMVNTKDIETHTVEFLSSLSDSGYSGCLLVQLLEDVARCSKNIVTKTCRDATER